MSQALRPLPGYFIRINAPQCLEDTWIVRPARARRAVAYVSRCETLGILSETYLALGPAGMRQTPRHRRRNDDLTPGTVHDSKPPRQSSPGQERQRGAYATSSGAGSVVSGVGAAETRHTSQGGVSYYNPSSGLHTPFPPRFSTCV